MPFCSGKSLSGALSALMDMETKESRFACLGQAGNIRHNQHTSILLIKVYTPGQLWYLFPTYNPRHCIRFVFAALRKLTSYQYMPPTNFVTVELLCILSIRQKSIILISFLSTIISQTRYVKGRSNKIINVMH